VKWVKNACWPGREVDKGRRADVKGTEGVKGIGIAGKAVKDVKWVKKCLPART
jgi:hypothetical protein